MDSLKGISKPLEYYGAGLEKKQRYRGQKDEDQDKYDLLFDYPSSRDQSEGKRGKRRERSDAPFRRYEVPERQEYTREKYEKNHSHDRYEWQARNDRRSKDERRDRSDRSDKSDNRKKYERNHSRDRYERLDRYDKQDKERS